VTNSERRWRRTGIPGRATRATSDAGAATALWNGSAGDTLFCTFSSRSDDGYAGIAYLDAFQIFTTT
jgi:hypothetical protein